MASTTETRRPLHATVTAFMARQGIEASTLRSDGRLTLTIDKKYRVHVQSAPDNRIALSAQLLALWGKLTTPATEQALERLMAVGAGMLQQHASTLCLDEQQQALLLQQTLAADTDVHALETAVADFVNALSFWSKACAAEASSL